MRETTFLAGVIMATAVGLLSAAFLVIISVNTGNFFAVSIGTFATALCGAMCWSAFDRFNRIITAEWRESQEESRVLSLTEDNGDHHRSQFLD